MPAWPTAPEPTEAPPLDPSAGDPAEEVAGSPESEVVDPTPEPPVAAEAEHGFDASLFPDVDDQQLRILPLPPAPAGPPTGEWSHLPPPPAAPPPRPAGADLGYYPAVPRSRRAPRPLGWARSPAVYSPSPRSGGARSRSGTPSGCNPIGRAIATIALIILFGNIVSTCVRSATDGTPFATSAGAPTQDVAASTVEAPTGPRLGRPELPEDVTLGEPAGGLRSGAVRQPRLDRTGETQVAQLTFPDGVEWAKQAWAASFDAEEVQVAVTPHSTFVAHDRRLDALEPSDGSTRWSAVLDWAPRRLDASGNVVVAQMDGHVAAFGADSARPLWTADLPGGSEVIVVGGQVLLATDVTDTSGEQAGRGGRVRVEAVDAATGKRSPAATIGCFDWGFSPSELDGRVAALPGGDLVAAPSTTVPCFARWSPSTGSVRWATKPELPDLDRNQAPVVAAHHLVGRTRGGDLYAVSLADGSARTIDAPAGFEAWPVVASGDLVAAEAVSVDGGPHAELIGFDVAAGRVRWRTALDKGVMPARLAYASVGGVELRPADGLRFVEVLDGARGELRTFTVDRPSGALVVLRVDPATGTRGILGRWTPSVGEAPYVSDPVRQGDRATIRVGDQILVLPLAGDGVIAGVR